MKGVVRILCAMLLLAPPSTAVAARQPEDIRSVYRDIAQQQAESEALQQEKVRDIRLKKADLKAELEQQQRRKTTLERKLRVKRAELEKRRKEYERLEQAQQQDHELMTNLSAAVRVSAKQLQELLIRSPLTALEPERPEQLDVILNADHFPGLDDMQLMAELFFSEMDLSRKVTYSEVEYRDRGGRRQTGPVLLVGPFLAVGKTAEQDDLLRYDSAGRTLSAVAAHFPWRLQRLLKGYLSGTSDSVPLDLTAGAALEQLTHSKSFRQRVREGGILVWPILLLAAVAALIGLERMIFLKRVHDNADRTMSDVNRRAEEGDWNGCQKLVEGRKTPVYNVVRAGIRARHEGREMLESILQEAILKELPRLERALPLLNIMGAVAPLLGLLGTVTGMIGTFEVINIYGTGDPRMMSGGISVALVTTMLGLTVAIPIMLLHTYLSRQVEHIIGDMEEKSVALTNIIHRHRNRRPHERAA